MTPPLRLKRVLFAAGLDASMKFSSTEEQVFLLARIFQQQSGLFLPAYQSDLSAESAAQYKAEGLQVESLDLTEFRLDTLNRLLYLLRRQKIEVVHWNFYSPSFNWYVWCLTVLMPRLEHYFTDHASRDLPLRTSGAGMKTVIKKILFKRYRKVLSGSDYMVACLRNDRTWTQPSRWYYCVNTDRFKPNPQVRSRLRMECGANKFVVLLVGNLIRQKGVDVALHALSLLPESFVLWIVGGGEEVENLRALCRALSLGDRVSFLGLQRNVETYMQASDCLICPSVWAEAAGQVNMEALSCGLPVVASRVGGIPEFIEEGKTGFLVTAGDPAELAQKLQSLANDPITLKRMSAVARAAAVERFSFQSHLSEYLNLYRA